MPISLDVLRAAADRPYRMTAAKTLDEAKAKYQQIAFLCHSHEDKALVRGLQILLNDNGWNVYIDWQDTAMPENPTRETALRIQNKITTLNWFLYLATPSSVLSKWCPWEIGYADKAKEHDRILVIPTNDKSGVWYGNEYLQLYRRIDYQTGILMAIREGKEIGLNVKHLE